MMILTKQVSSPTSPNDLIVRTDSSRVKQAEILNPFPLLRIKDASLGRFPHILSNDKTSV